MRQGNIDEIEDVSQWVRGIFKRSWLKHDVYHLIWDFSGGLIIIYLAEALTCRKLPLLYSKPKDFAEKIGNIELALQAFKDDGVEFPGIFAHDIANGDEEIIIMLCYILKHHYSADQPARGWTIDVEQASHLGPLFLFDDASKASVDNRLDFEPFEKEDISLFDWVSHQIGKEILDYQIFKDGFILCKLINIVSPRRIPEKVIASASDLERIKLALDFGFHELKIRTELQPRDVLQGKKRPMFRKFLNRMRTIQTQQMQILENQSNKHLLESMSFIDKSLRCYNFYDLFYDNDSRFSASHAHRHVPLSKKTEDAVEDVKDLDRKKQEKTDALLLEEKKSVITGLKERKETFGRLPGSSESSVVGELRNSWKSKTQTLNVQLSELQKSIHLLRCKTRDTKSAYRSHGSSEKSKAVVEDDTSSEKHACNDVHESQNDAIHSRYASIQSEMKDRSSGAKKDNEARCGSAELFRHDNHHPCQPGNKDSVVDSVDCGGNTNNHRLEKMNTGENRTSATLSANITSFSLNSRALSPNGTSFSSDGTSCSSQSTTNHAATRYVLLNSRKPKGSADD